MYDSDETGHRELPAREVLADCVSTMAEGQSFYHRLTGTAPLSAGTHLFLPVWQGWAAGRPMGGVQGCPELAERVKRTGRNDREGTGKNKEVGARQVGGGRNLAGQRAGHVGRGPKPSSAHCRKLRRMRR